MTALEAAETAPVKGRAEKAAKAQCIALLQAHAGKK
jgi:hypothetical protein